QLVLEVGHGPQALDDGGDAPIEGVVDQQAVELVDLEIGQVGGDLGQHLGALDDGEYGGLVGVLHHRHQDLVEEAGGALDDVEVPERHRVEGAGNEGPGHPAASPSASSVATPCWRRTRV